jgi:hypothetical protein
MDTGFDTLKDVVDVLLVPISVGLLALVWPSWIARRRRQNFRYLVRVELQEAVPRTGSDGNRKRAWHEYLSRRFLHERVIWQAAGDTDFLLSLNPQLAYVLSQLWISFDKGSADQANSQEHAEQWIWYLGQTCLMVDRKRGRRSLVEMVWRPWRNLVHLLYPDASLDEAQLPPRR